MAAHGLSSLWRRRPVRVLVGLTVFAVALAAQYYLTNVPAPADLAETGKFAPAIVQLGQQELLIEGPEVNSPEGTLFSHDGATNEIMDVRFERARPDKDTADMLTALGDTLPSAPTQVTYLPQEPEPGAPCRTTAMVAWAEAQKPPNTLRLYQRGTPGLDRERQFEMGVEGGELAVQLLPKVGTEAAPVARGCQNLLTIGALEEPITGEAGMTVVAAAGSTFRWHFGPRTEGQPPWGNADGLFEPFTLGAPQLAQSAQAQTNQPAQPPLRARAVRIRAQHAAPDAPDALSARSTDGGPPLTISALKLGSAELQLNVTGNGWVKINGTDRTVNVFERVEKYPLTSALFGALNSALLAWVGYTIFGRHKHTAAGQPGETKGQD